MILSDKWITRQCVKPTHRLINALGGGTPLIRPPYSESEQHAINNWDPETGHERFVKQPYAIPLHDFDGELLKWQPMIEPFEPKQVRGQYRQLTEDEKFDYYNNHPIASNKPVEIVDDVPMVLEKFISYGVSSFGYDVRCADEFKIFTNINNQVIDPKNFNDKIFVDHKGPTCIIPPNSFALARTVEYFRIPRDVLTICLGKSTYARCFTGDTKVALVDGTSATFVELVERADKGEKLFGYSADPQGNLVVSELTAPRKIGHEKVLAVTLDNGEVIRCTPDHKFMLRDGSYVEAQHLTEGQSLMPLYRGEYSGYESVYQPNAGMMVSTHWLADAWNLRNGVYSATNEKIHRHHVDHNRRNNRPDNIERLSSREHARHHNEERWASVEARANHGDAIANAISQLMDDSDWFANYCTQQSNRAKAFWNDPEYAESREQLIEGRRNPSDETRRKHRTALLERFTSHEERVLHSERMRNAWAKDPDRKQRQGVIARMINIRDDITESVVKAALALTGSIRGAARHIGCDRSVFRRFPELMSEFSGGTVANNHKVVSITEVEGTHDVYCLTVPEFGNFALEAGVIVKNCGIIVNVTPLEPEWEGHVTLEFSNTTNLPAIIYANEGVAQMLFLRGDEPCEMSYKDRGGKYQGQTGVTLPKA